MWRLMGPDGTRGPECKTCHETSNHERLNCSGPPHYHPITRAKVMKLDMGIGATIHEKDGRHTRSRLPAVYYPDECCPGCVRSESWAMRMVRRWGQVRALKAHPTYGELQGLSVRDSTSFTLIEGELRAIEQWRSTPEPKVG